MKKQIYKVYTTTKYKFERLSFFNKPLGKYVSSWALHDPVYLYASSMTEAITYYKLHCYKSVSSDKWNIFNYSDNFYELLTCFKFKEVKLITSHDEISVLEESEHLVDFSTLLQRMPAQHFKEWLYDKGDINDEINT